MNSKTLISALLGAIVSFAAGYLIYGLLLKDFFHDHSVAYAGLMKDPPEIWAIGVANLAWGLATAYIFNMGNVRTAGKGFVKGFIIFCLLGIATDLLMFAQMNLFSLKLAAIDVAISAVLGALAGTVIGWWLGRGTKAA